MNRVHISTAVILLALFYSLVFWLLNFIARPADGGFLASHANEFQLENSRFNLAVYVGLIFAVGLACLLWLLARTDSFFKKSLAGDIAARQGFLLALMPIALSGRIGSFGAGFVLFLLLTILARDWDIRGVSKRIRLDRIVVALLVVYGSLYIIVPLFMPLILSYAGYFSHIDSHFSMTVLPGFDLVCCQETGTAERSNYGLSMLLLSAVGYKVASLAGLQDGALTYAVKAYQLVALGLIIAILYRLNRKYFLALTAVLLAIAAPLNTLDNAVYFPNQSGIRFIPFLLGVAFLAWQMHRTAKPGVILSSVVSSLLIVLSPETGMALFGGFAVFLILTEYDLNNRYRSTLVTFGLFLISCVLQILLLSKFLVPLFFTGNAADTSSNLDLFTSGNAGLIDNPSPFSTLLLFFGLFAVARGVWRARRGTLSRTDTFQSALGVMIVVWLFYYVNRMVEFNLWFQAVLVIFLFAPRADMSCLRLFRQKSRFGSMYMVLVIAFLGGQFLSTMGLLSKHTDRLYWMVKADCFELPAQVPGFCFVGPDGAIIQRQLEFAKNLADKQQYLALSHFPAQVRLLGFNEGFPWYDPYGETPSKKDFAGVVDWIRVASPRYILVDDPESKVSKTLAIRTGHLADIVDAVGGYEPRQAQSGWVIFERIAEAKTAS